MVSGIKTNEEVNAVYKQLRVDRKIKALIIKINDKTELEVESQFPTEGFKYDDFVAAFPSDQGRFAVIDFDYDHPDGRKDFKRQKTRYAHPFNGYYSYNRRHNRHCGRRKYD